MSKPERSLEGKAAVVTGAGRGIGRAIAIVFAKAGANIAICARSENELEQVRELIESTGVRCVVGVADLTDKSASEKFCAETTATFGHVDILVNNAGGLLERSKISDSDIDQWWKTIELNIKAPYLVTRLLPDNLSDGAKIINRCSLACGQSEQRLSRGKSWAAYVHRGAGQ